MEQRTDNDDVIGKRYEYEGVPGRIKVDGVEVVIASLSEAERIAAGEQLLRAISRQSGTSVSQLRQAVTAISQANVPPPKRPELRLVNGQRMLVNSGPNRRDRKRSESIARKKPR